MVKLGARFVRACRTAARYRFFAFMDLEPPKPGLLRDDSRAGAIMRVTHARGIDYEIAHGFVLAEIAK